MSQFGLTQELVVLTPGAPGGLEETVAARKSVPDGGGVLIGPRD